MPTKPKAAKSKNRSTISRIRDEFPPVRLVRRRNGSTVYRVDCRSTGWVGQSTYEFPTRKDALEKARAIAEAVAARGPGVVSASIAAHDQGEVGTLTRRLAAFGKTLQDAAVHYLAHLEAEQSRQDSLRVPDLLTRWNRFKQDPSQQLRPRSKKSLQWWSQRFAAEFAKQRIADLTHDFLRKHYDQLVDTRGKSASPRYRKQFVGYLGQFFNWCIQQGHTTSNPTLRIKVRSSVPDAEFLSLESSILGY